MIGTVIALLLALVIVGVGVLSFTAKREARRLRDREPGAGDE